MKDISFDKCVPLFTKALGILLLIFPLGLSFLLVLRKLFKVSPLISLSLFVLFLGLFILIISKVKFSLNSKKTNLFMLIVLVFLTVFFRLEAIDTFQTPASADFYLAFEAATKWLSGPNFSPQHFFFPHWGIYAVFLSKALLFGKTIYVAKVLNILAATISVLAVYFALKKSTGKTNLAFTGGLILAIWPSYVAYTNILSGENLFITFFSLALLALAYYFSSKPHKKQYLAIFVFAIFLALANIFKETTIVTIPIALFVFSFSYLLESLKPKELFNKIAITFSLLILASVIVTSASHKIVSYYAKGPANNSKTAYFIATGLSFQTNGRYNREIAKKYTDPLNQAVQEKNINQAVYKKSDNKIKNELITSLKQNYAELPKLFINKFYSVWASEEEINNWLYESYGPSPPSIVASNVKTLNVVSNAFFAVIILSSLFGTTQLLREKSKINSVYFFSSLFTLGFALALLIIEMLTRYRTILYPALAIQAAFGLEYLINLIKVKQEILKVVQQQFFRNLHNLK